MKLSVELYNQCLQYLLKCDKCESHSRFVDFCKPREDLSILANKVEKRDSREKFAEHLLNILCEIENQDGDSMLLVYLKALLLMCSSEKVEYYELNLLYDKLVENYNRTHITSPSTSLNDKYSRKLRQKISAIQDKDKQSKTQKVNERKLFNELLSINFVNQQKQIIDALVLQKRRQRKTAAFLVHGEKDYGQEFLVYRLYGISQYLPELENAELRKIKVGGMTDINHLWTDIGNRFHPDFDPNEDDWKEQIKEKILKFVQKQNLIFMFYDVRRTTKDFLPALIEDFWQPIVESASNNEKFLVMFIVDSKGNVCNLDLFITSEINDNNFPQIPLNLHLSSGFTMSDIVDWFASHSREARKVINANHAYDKLLEDFENSIAPELAYKKICEYCNTNWESVLTKCQIQ